MTVIGRLLGVCWASVGRLLGVCWASVGRLLGVCWASVGRLLGVYWAEGLGYCVTVRLWNLCFPGPFPAKSSPLAFRPNCPVYRNQEMSDKLINQL